MAATAKRRLPEERRRKPPSGTSSTRQSASSPARASDVRTAVEILRKVKTKVVGDEFDDESQRHSHEGRLDDHEGRLQAVEESQVERAKAITGLQRWRNEMDAWRAVTERRMDKADKAMRTPQARKVSLAFFFSKRALQILLAIMAALAVFVGTLILTLRDGPPGFFGVVF